MTGAGISRCCALPRPQLGGVGDLNLGERQNRHRPQTPPHRRRRRQSVVHEGGGLSGVLLSSSVPPEM